MIGAVILTHGQLGQELLNTVEGIAGKQEEVVVLSNSNETYDAVKKRVMDGMERLLSSRERVLLVDMPGGSCWRVAQELVQTTGERRLTVLSGINLPMLLSFFMKRNMFDYNELVQILENDGKKGIRLG